jgi:hypothetical protein
MFMALKYCSGLIGRVGLAGKGSEVGHVEHLVDTITVMRALVGF